MSELHVERIGGLAGLGTPMCAIRSAGRCDLESLNASDRASIQKLFDNQGKAKRSTRATQARDTLKYRLSQMIDGQSVVIEVDESELPHSVVLCVKDTLI